MYLQNPAIHIYEAVTMRLEIIVFDLEQTNYKTKLQNYALRTNNISFIFYVLSNSVSNVFEMKSFRIERF